MLFSRHLSLCRRRAAEAASRRVSFVRWRAGTYRDAIFKLYEARVVNLKGVRCLAVSFGPRWQGALIRSHRAGSLWSGHKRFGSALKKHEQRPPSAAFQPSYLSSLLIEQHARRLNLILGRPEAGTDSRYVPSAGARARRSL